MEPNIESTGSHTLRSRGRPVTARTSSAGRSRPPSLPSTGRISRYTPSMPTGAVGSPPEIREQPAKLSTMQTAAIPRRIDRPLLASPVEVC
ncbi:Uncharacterised protein [Mycobacteroides abscessus subsp. abscessus]|nr:Uncharacterised protein [Mycobacteroides abscessus subsp. abscessus]